MSQTPYTKFGFDTEFFELVQSQKGLSGGAAAPATAQQKAQLEDIRRAGYDEGYATGLVEGQKQAQADLALVQQHVQNTLMSLQKATQEREEELLRQTLTLLRQTLHHMVGHAVRHYPSELFEHHLRTIIPLLGGDQSLTLRIHPSARGYHEKLALPQASIMGMPMNLKSDASLGPTDAVVEWTNGGVEAKLAQHLAAVDDLLAGAGAALLPVESRPDLSPQAATLAPQAARDTDLAPPLTDQPPVASEPAADIESAAASAARDRARQLLGDDDDDLVDALK